MVSELDSVTVALSKVQTPRLWLLGAEKVSYLFLSVSVEVVTFSLIYHVFSDDGHQQANAMTKPSFAYGNGTYGM